MQLPEQSAFVFKFRKKIIKIRCTKSCREEFPSQTLKNGLPGQTHEYCALATLRINTFVFIFAYIVLWGTCLHIRITGYTHRSYIRNTILPGCALFWPLGHLVIKVVMNWRRPSTSCLCSWRNGTHALPKENREHRSVGIWYIHQCILIMQKRWWGYLFFCISFCIFCLGMWFCISAVKVILGVAQTVFAFLPLF